jgi:hypothetical protein
MRDFVLIDPSGVLWRIAQNTEQCRKFPASAVGQRCTAVARSDKR